MYLPAEWHRQAFVQLTWPHKDTDWAPVLDDAIDCFCAIAQEVAKREPLLIVAQHPDETRHELERHGVATDQITIVECPTNDTWARDHAFITCLDNDGQPLLNDYQFNGWGMKFAANFDNRINSRIRSVIRKLYYKADSTSNQQRTTEVQYRNQLDFVLEGGSIESDGEGTIMVTSSCLLSTNRNDTLSRNDIEQRLMCDLGAKRVLWLEHSWLAGDDTDGHIDTVARFCSPTSIAYVKCNDPADIHYDELRAMEQELQALRTTEGQPYTLHPLPLPSPCHDEDGLRLPATYANFLIVNGAVLVPTYGQPDNDRAAIDELRHAFPNHEVVGIDCKVLIIQHGSLHCSTMQYPAI